MQSCRGLIAGAASDNRCVTPLTIMVTTRQRLFARLLAAHVQAQHVLPRLILLRLVSRKIDEAGVIRKTSLQLMNYQ